MLHIVHNINTMGYTTQTDLEYIKKTRLVQQHADLIEAMEKPYNDSMKIW